MNRKGTFKFSKTHGRITLLFTTLILIIFATGCLQRGGGNAGEVMKPGVYAMVTFGPANKIAVFDTSTFEVVKTIELSGKNNHGLRAFPNNKYVSVCSRDSDVVMIIDTSTMKEIKAIPVGDTPHHSAVTIDSRYIYAPNIFSDDVSVIDTSIWEEVKRIKFGQYTGPTQVEASPDGKWIWVITEKSNELALIDTATQKIVSRWVLPNVPRDLVISPDSKVVYVTVRTHLIGYDVEGNVKLDLQVGEEDGRLRGIDISQDGKTIYVDDMNTDDLYKIDIPTETWTKISDLSFKAGCGLRLSPNGRQLWVVTQGDNDIYAFDTATDELIMKMPMYDDPHEVGFVTIE